ncbi:MAG TPA: hypothetical protein VMF52_10260 [Steroidobacteraceae bacterium]|nr:hypothetical protein [Steroidobacteraceae bacterium]
MTTPQELYAAVKGDLGALAKPLFAKSEQLLRERGDFLPHAAVLAPDGKVTLLGAMCITGDGFANSWHILPMVHDGLRAMARERDLAAVGVAERVDAIPGHGAGRAVKVQLEHHRGLTIAFYMSITQDDQGATAFGRMVTLFSESEVNAWSAA